MRRAAYTSTGPTSAIVAAILVIAITANVIANLKFPAVLDVVPVIGLAVWIVILATAPLRQPDWKIMPETFKGTIFLLALVTNASFMPVEQLPLASWQTALGLGFLSSVFDNIPLTALALKQGGYDWGFLAYCVGFGGSMIWFGSSAGVAISNMYPEAKSVGRWLRHGWFVAVSYVVGFFVMLAIVGWNPDAPHKKRVELDTNYHQAAVAHPEGQPRADRMSAIDAVDGSSTRHVSAEDVGAVKAPAILEEHHADDRPRSPPSRLPTRSLVPAHCPATSCCGNPLRRHEAAIFAAWQKSCAASNMAAAVGTTGYPGAFESMANQSRGQCHVQPQNLLVARRWWHHRAPIGVRPAGVPEGRALCKWDRPCERHYDVDVASAELIKRANSQRCLPGSRTRYVPPPARLQ